MMTLNGITMGLIAEVLLLVTAQSQNSNLSGNELVFRLMEQLYNMRIKPKIETMKTKIKDLELYIAAQKKQMETLQDRKTIKCESGTVGQHTFPAPKWPYIQNVQFKSHFDEIPTVTYGLFLLDSDYRNNLRLSTGITAVTKTGFRVKFSTWANTILYGARINWMACGK